VGPAGGRRDGGARGAARTGRDAAGSDRGGDGLPGAETAQLVLHRYALQLRRAEELAGDSVGSDGASPSATLAQPQGADAVCGDDDSQDADAAVVRAATEAQRQRLVALRADGTIGDAAFQRVEEELDWAELDWAQLLRAGERVDGAA
jgi:hypothetical protein